MAKMTLGGYTFASDPKRINGVMKKDRPVSSIKTNDSVAVFMWPATWAGQEVILSWRLLSTAQYEQFRTFYLAGSTITFDPQDGSGLTFDVVVKNLRGDYFIAKANAAGNHRQNVDLTLVIIAEQ